MKNHIVVRLIQLDRRILLLVMVTLLIAIALEAWLLIFRQPVAEYRQLQSERFGLEQSLRDAIGLQAEADKLAQDVATLSKEAEGGGVPSTMDQLLIQTVGNLDRIAGEHGVALQGVKPGAARHVPMFDEVSFDVEVRGKYGALMEWLHAVEKDMRTLAVVQFSLKSGSQSGPLTMSLKLAAYRATETAGVGR